MQSKKRGSIPGMIGKAARRSGVVGPLKPRQFSSELVPVDPGPVADPEREMHLRSLVGKFSGDLNRKAMKVRFLSLLDPGSDRQLRLGPAWRACHPRTTATDKSCGERGSAFYAEILNDLGPSPEPADVLALCGIHVGSIGQDLARMRFAKIRREYYDFKTHTITPGKDMDDNMAILRTIELSMRAIGIGKEKEGGGVVQVNIVQYNDPALPPPHPSWGRVGLDGVMRPTCGPGAVAVMGSAPPAGSLGEPKDGV